MAVAKASLKQMAEELEVLLAAPRPVPQAPVIDESYLIAAETPSAPVTQSNEHLIPQLVRSVVEYTLSRSPAGASADQIGGAITTGINEAVKHLGLDRSKVGEALDTFLDELAESVRGSMGE